MKPWIARSLLVGLVVIAGLAAVVSVGTGRDEVEQAVVAEERERGASAGGAPVRESELPVSSVVAPAVDAAGWLNTEPLSPAELEGRVVLYEFWTFGCVNCRNVLPYVRAWHERYAADGLVVLSVHTPEFEYERDASAVAEFVEAEGIEYPVALDPERRTWRAFDNHAWPAFYLHDAEGRRRLVHIGEGGYDRTEDAIRALLGVEADARRAVVEG